MYVDGFNFYHAVKDLGQSHLKWMSYTRLARILINRGETVELVKVFSAFAAFKPGSAARHKVYHAAVEAEGAEWVMGQFKEKTLRCTKPGCGHVWKGHEEKETDVNIALHLLCDCNDDKIDVAYLLTTDSDLTPAVQTVIQRGCPVELVTVSTPGRGHCKELLATCHRKAKVNTKMVEACVMEREILGPSGVVVATRPSEYDPPSGWTAPVWRI